MAVYTILTDEDLETVRIAFGLGEINVIKGIAEGVQNTNYYVEAGGERHILTIYEKMVDVSDLPFFLGATEMAAKLGLPTARPIRTQSGEITLQIAGKTCSVCTFLNGISPRNPNATQAKSAGAALAKLHLALADSGLNRSNDLGPNAWPVLWDKCKLGAEQLETGVGKAIEADLADFAQYWPKDLPSGFIHADLFPDNVLFLGNEVSGLIDFYFAATDFFAYDLAVMLNAWCFLPLGREFDLTKGRALIAGYESVRKLSDAECAAIPILARGAALRFFLTRMMDWSRPDDGSIVTKKDPREYSARLAFHRAAKSIMDYGRV
ncbi:MAG: homoserine kinase type II [Hyphomonadaceae bacterium]|nr:MAG: homoserine kinase type II [Hyphomonadaceae bacterium]KAF0186175.1 MAG: homoserine kinase type II [Hyphomonadaceae bacterium]